jgi:hypothetical protein
LHALEFPLHTLAASEVLCEEGEEGLLEDDNGEDDEVRRDKEDDMDRVVSLEIE